jgi:hypothetical protein
MPAYHVYKHILEDIMNVPKIIPLKAKIVDHVVSFWWDSKWRTIGYYHLTNRIPSKAFQEARIAEFALNTGLPVTQQYEITSWEV